MQREQNNVYLPQNGGFLLQSDGSLTTGQVLVSVDASSFASELLPTQPLPPTSLDTLANAATAFYLPKAAATTRAKCSECGSAFADGQEFFSHWLERHCRPTNKEAASASTSASSTPTSIEDMAAVSGNNLSLEQCRGCELVFVRATEKYEEHKLTCKGRLKRPISSSQPVASIKKPRDASSVVPTPSFTCGLCLSDVKSITSFFLHWLDHHKDVLEVLQEVWRCGKCSVPRLFPDEGGIEAHYNVEHGNEDQATVMKSQCARCGKEFETAKDRDSHARLHDVLSPPSSSPCPTCGDSFSDLLSHHETSHESKCSLCNLRVTPERLSDHLSRRHRCERVWDRHSEDSLPSSSSSTIKKCKSCSVSFTSEKLLEKHYFANHEFQCKFCDKTMDKDIYGDHLRIHLAKQRKSKLQK